MDNISHNSVISLFCAFHVVYKSSDFKDACLKLMLTHRNAINRLLRTLAIHIYSDQRRVKTSPASRGDNRHRIQETDGATA